jgi:hypothetical protein
MNQTSSLEINARSDIKNAALHGTRIVVTVFPKSLPMVPFLSLKNSVQSLIPYFFEIHFNSIFQVVSSFQFFRP